VTEPQPIRLSSPTPSASDGHRGRLPVLDKREGGRLSPLFSFSVMLNYAQEIANGLSDMGYHWKPLQAQNPIFSPDVLCLV